MTPCLSDDALVRLEDGALSVEETARSRAHLLRCPRCRERDDALRAVFADLKADVAAPVDVRGHARAVMERIDRADRPGGSHTARTGPAWSWRGASTGALAACALGVAVYGGLHRSKAEATWQSRGGGLEATTARDVALQPYALRGALRSLTSGAIVNETTPLTAGFRNLGASPAYLLLFAVDGHRVVHWISPRYARAGDDPASTPLPPTVDERLLTTTVVLEDVAPGPLRVVAVITTRPAHVSDVEAFEGLPLDASLLVQRLPGADVRETVVDVADSDGGMQ